MLINCPECQREISDAAPSCPGCGYMLKPAAKPSANPVEQPPSYFDPAGSKRRAPGKGSVAPDWALRWFVGAGLGLVAIAAIILTARPQGGAASASASADAASAGSTQPATAENPSSADAASSGDEQSSQADASTAADAGRFAYNTDKIAAARIIQSDEAQMLECIQGQASSLIVTLRNRSKVEAALMRLCVNSMVGDGFMTQPIASAFGPPAIQREVDSLLATTQ
jgi:hypothetical protein